ncbi:hypothetical protein [Amorphus sp. MBR-141]
MAGPENGETLPAHVRDWLRDLSPEQADYLERMNSETLKWLSEMRAEEVTEIREGVEFIRAARRMGAFGRWVLFMIAAIFAATMSIGEGWKAARAWWGS